MRSFTIAGVIEDDRVHTADLALLPVDGTVQDPTDPVDEPVSGGGSGGGGGGGYGLIPALDMANYDSVRAYATVSKLLLTGWGQGFAAAQNGLTGAYLDLVRIPNWWLLAAGTAYGEGPFDPADGALFEVRATLVSGSVPDGDLLDTWLSLASNRYWQVSAVGTGAYASSVFHLEIRDVATSVVQAVAYNVTLTAEGYPPVTEGG